MLRRPPTMNIPRSLLYLVGVLFTSCVVGDQQTLGRPWLCDVPPNVLSCHGKSVRLGVYECGENEPFSGGRLPAYDPLLLNISVYWGEHLNETSNPAPDDPGYERINVNYATGETDSNQGASSYFVHEGKNTSVFHAYDKPGVYRPIFTVCITDPISYKRAACAISCGYDNYLVDKSNSTDKFNSTVIHYTFCDPRPFYIDADGTCSENPILPKLPSQGSSSKQMFHSGWIRLGLVLLLTGM
jgi:hypothetical protein